MLIVTEGGLKIKESLKQQKKNINYYSIHKDLNQAFRLGKFVQDSKEIDKVFKEV